MISFLLWVVSLDDVRVGLDNISRIGISLHLLGAWFYVGDLVAHKHSVRPGRRIKYRA